VIRRVTVGIDGTTDVTDRATNDVTAKATVNMSAVPDIRQVRSAARILLICPECGQENSELADKLRNMSTYFCHGDGCEYSFDLAGARRDVGKGFADACKRFYAAFYAPRGQGAR
jgi:hypothetical protein